MTFIFRNQGADYLVQIKRPTIDFRKIPTPMFKGHIDFVLLVEFFKKKLATIECRSITIFKTF